MAISLDNIELKLGLPKLPSSMSLFELDSPPIEIRKKAIEVLGENPESWDVSQI